MKPDKEPEICAICMDNMGDFCRQDGVYVETGSSQKHFDNPTVPILCGHRFHSKCIQAYMQSGGVRCPVCRNRSALVFLERQFHCQIYHCERTFFVIFCVHYKYKDNITQVLGWNYGTPPRDLLLKYCVRTTTHIHEEKEINSMMEAITRKSIAPDLYIWKMTH